MSRDSGILWSRRVFSRKTRSFETDTRDNGTSRWKLCCVSRKWRVYLTQGGFFPVFGRQPKAYCFQDFFSNPLVFCEIIWVFLRIYNIIIFVAVFGQVRSVCFDGFSDHCTLTSPYYYCQRGRFLRRAFFYMCLPLGVWVKNLKGYFPKSY